MKTRLEQLELALGILLEHVAQDMPKNPRLLPEWFVACAAVEARQATEATDETLQRAHSAALQRIQNRG